MSKSYVGVTYELDAIAAVVIGGTRLSGGVGAATNEDPRELDIPLGFLGEGRYEALVMEDGDDSDYRTHKESYKAAKRAVTRADTIHVKLAPGGGACVLLKEMK